MSQGQKLMERPKVRFCQPSENSFVNSEKPNEPFHASSANKPRIRSIVNLEDPYKIIHKNGDVVSSSKENVENIDTRYSAKSTCNAQSSSHAKIHRPLSGSFDANSKTLSNIKPTSPHTQKSSQCINNAQNTALKGNSENCKRLPSASNLKSLQSTASKSRSKTSALTTESCRASKYTAQVKTSVISKPEKASVSKIGSRHATIKTMPCTVKKVSRKTVPVSNENVVLPKNVACGNNVSKINRQKEKTAGKIAMPCSSRSVAIAKTVNCGLKISKPGTRVWKTRSKSSPVKKTILRDVTGYPTNVHVGPGVTRYYSEPSRMNLEKEKLHIRPDIVAGDKLSRPEYNSIICTIDELKKVQAEKFVTDVEHLPLVYRNLVNEKVSAALDFPPDEVIYRNLVDLSVNENQLPSRLTRSKDPEPRHKDMVPKLSDFFTPTFSEEYCTAVQIRPSSPEIFTNWSAFAISDKIFGWKHDMDQCY